MRSDGFERMDVSTSIDDDPKFRLLARRHPDLFATALAAYVGLLARSWREGERLTLEEGWPSLLAIDEGAITAMHEAGLVDDEERLPRKAWDAWFGAAAERRQLGRERQHRADVKRGRAPSTSPSGSTGSSGTQSVSQTGPTRDQRWSNGGRAPELVKTRKNGSGKVNGVDPSVAEAAFSVGIVPTAGNCRDCGGYLTDKEPCKVGPGWIEHAEHPEWAS